MIHYTLSMRDTRWCPRSGIAVYCRNIGGGVRPGRIWLDSVNVPINCGGVLVFPGDLFVGDGDGVIVVPREHALQVGEIARSISDGDQSSRFNHYKDLGIPLDETVMPFESGDK